MAWNIWGHSLPEMETWITSHGFPKFRAKQLAGLPVPPLYFFF